MSVVRKVVEGELHLDIPIAGLAKNDRHRTNELLFGDPPRSVAVGSGSELFNVLTRMQDEVHRYAITFHRDKRSRHALHSTLDNIKGIGPVTKRILMDAFGNVRNIANADINTLSQATGQAKAEIVWRHFHDKEP